MIAQSMSQKIAEAMKAHDEVRLSTLRLLSSAFNYEFIAKQHPLSLDEELAVIRKEAKKRKEAIEAFEKIQKSKNPSVQERIEREKKELEILQEFLPADMSDEEVEALVAQAIAETGATTMADMGKVMGNAVAKAQGRADGAKISQIVRSKLN